MKALVTGGAGFIGSHLTEALLSKGHNVTVIDDLSAGNKENLDLKRVKLIVADIQDEKAMKRALKGVNVVFHQAALRSVPKSVSRPMSYHAVNATATLQLLNLSKDLGVKRVVMASSSSCYGEAPMPQKESYAPAPESPYAATKLVDEVYAGLFHRLHGLETVCLRYFNVFGPRQSLESQYAVVVPKFIVSLLKGTSPPIHGDGKQSRDFTYVANVVNANLRAAAAAKTKVSGQVFNVASGKHYTVLDLAKRLAKILGVDIGPTFLGKRPGDVLHTCGSSEKAKKLMGFSVSIPFDAGLLKTAEWFKAHPEFWS